MTKWFRNVEDRLTRVSNMQSLPPITTPPVTQPMEETHAEDSLAVGQDQRLGHGSAKNEDFAYTISDFERLFSSHKDQSTLLYYFTI